jgi:hypothetical protein
MRDRLRNAEAPEAIQDAIGGWSSRSIGQGCGRGYELKLLHQYMLKIVLP